VLKNGVDMEIGILHWESHQLDEKRVMVACSCMGDWHKQLGRKKGWDHDAVASLVQQKVEVGNKYNYYWV